MHDVLHIAVEDSTEVIDRGGIHRLVFPEFVDGRTGYVVSCDQGIGGLIRFFQCCPKWLIANHTNASQDIMPIHLVS